MCVLCGGQKEEDYISTVVFLKTLFYAAADLAFSFEFGLDLCARAAALNENKSWLCNEPITSVSSGPVHRRVKVDPEFDY